MASQARTKSMSQIENNEAEPHYDTPGLDAETRNQQEFQRVGSTLGDLGLDRVSRLIVHHITPRFF